jgi:hypothetical protein
MSLLLTLLLCSQIWIEKSREQKLDYDMKSFNANKASNGDVPASKSTSTPSAKANPSGCSESLQVKAVVPEAPVTMSQ